MPVATTDQDPSGDQRLFREAQALARLAHPNVVAVYDVGRWESRVWVAMELVPGTTLRAWVREGAREPRACHEDQGRQNPAVYTAATAT